MAADNLERFYMTDILRYILLPIAISILFSILGILFNSWLCKIGVSRDTKWQIIIIGTFFLVFLKQFFYENVSWWFYGIVLILGVTLAVNRSDLGETMKKGAWWWEAKENKKKKRSNSL
jgi:hypothetical protein